MTIINTKSLRNGESLWKLLLIRPYGQYIVNNNKKNNKNSTIRICIRKMSSRIRLNNISHNIVNIYFYHGPLK